MRTQHGTDFPFTGIVEPTSQLRARENAAAAPRSASFLNNATNYKKLRISKPLFNFEKLFKPQEENHDDPSSDDFDFDATQERASDSCDT